MADRGVNFQFTAVNRAKAAMASVTGGLKRMGGQLDASRRKVNMANVANKRFSQTLGGSSWKRQVQQAGMQVSDFAVQVAGGQSAILAFTQNAPQFVQNFGAIGGAAAAVITILGTMAYMAQRSGNAVISFSKQLDKTSESLNKYVEMTKAANGLSADNLDRQISALKVTSETARILYEIERSKAFRSMDALTESLVKSVESASSLKTEVEDIGTLLGQSMGAKIAAVMGGALGREIRKFDYHLENLKGAGNIDDMLIAALALREQFSGLVDVHGEMTSQQRAFWEELNVAIQNLEIFGATAKVAVEEVRRTAQEMVNVSIAANDAWRGYYASRVAATNLADETGRAADAADRLASNMVLAARGQAILHAARNNPDFFDPRNDSGNAGQTDPNRWNTWMTLPDVRMPPVSRSATTTTTAGATGGVPAVDEMQQYMESQTATVREFLDRMSIESLDVAKRVGSAFKETQGAISSSISSSFKALLDGSRSMGEAVTDILGNIADRVIDLLMTPIFDRAAGGIASAIMGPMVGAGIGPVMSFEGGGFTGAGVRAGGLDGRGGRLAVVHPNEKVTDETRGQSSGGVTVNQYITTPDADSFKRSSRQIARQARGVLG